MIEVEQHYSAAKVADLLEVTERTVWNYVKTGIKTAGKDGIYPVIKISHKNVRIPARALHRFLAARTITAGEKKEGA